MSRIPKNAEKKFEGTIFTTWQWPQELYDGSTTTFEAVTRPNYATAIGVLPNKEILLVWDEQPDRDPLLTSAGGRVEDGENPDGAAIREFREETGYAVGTLVPWFTHKPGTKVEYWVHFYIAKNLTEAGSPEPDPGEKIELRTFSFENFLRLGSEDSNDIGGPVRDPMLRIKLLEASLDKNKREQLHSLLYGN